MPTISFRPLSPADHPLLLHWFGQPHVVDWWRDSPQTLEAVAEKYTDRADEGGPSEQFVIEADGAPIGLIQRYRHGDHPRWDAAIGVPDAAGIDYLIGEPGMIGRGVGTAAIRAFTADVLDRYPDVAVVLAVPQLDNRASCRALEKAGYLLVDQRDLDSDDPSDAGPSAIYAYPRFLPGLVLCQAFYDEAVRPVLDEAFPGLAHAAARIGQGSEVLGLDTRRSTDHDWGPALQLFVGPEVDRRGLYRLLSRRLPVTFRGWPVQRRPSGPATWMSEPGPWVQVSTVSDWFSHQLGFDPLAGVGMFDWLATPTQLLAEATGGAVFHDGIGSLDAARAALGFYPEDVWRYVLACQWVRIGQEQPFVGRAVEVGDDAGAAVVAARLVRDLMRLGLLLHRRYPPYSKWLGTAFARLPRSGQLPGLPLADPDALARAYQIVGGWQNELKLAAAIDPAPRPFHDRPYPVIDADGFAAALREAIADPVLRSLPPIGAIDQFVDSTDVLGRPELCRAILRAAWAEAGLAG